MKPYQILSCVIYKIIVPVSRLQFADFPSIDKSMTCHGMPSHRIAIRSVITYFHDPTLESEPARLILLVINDW
jgi:hypothetical protein